MELLACICGGMDLKFWTLTAPPKGYERDRVICMDCGRAGPVVHKGNDPMRRTIAVKRAWNEMVSACDICGSPTEDGSCCGQCGDCAEHCGCSSRAFSPADLADAPPDHETLFRLGGGS